MLDINLIREKPEYVKEMAARKGADIDIDAILEADKAYRKLLQETEQMRAQKNAASEKISGVESEEREKIINEMREIDVQHDKLEHLLKEQKEKLEQLLRTVPNLPFEHVPIGGEEANAVLREVGERPQFDFEVKDYMELAAMHDLIDTERAGKVSGTRFGYLKGKAVLFEFALVRYALDMLIKEGFVPVVPPVMIKPEYMDAMGFLQGEAADDVYFLEKDKLYLVGTSEQSIGPMHADEVFSENDLPLRYAGFSTCFRREAGASGKDTKGILRVHQFDKVEMVVFCHPEESRKEHQYLLSLNERMMGELKLPYRVVQIATKDMGIPKAEQFDIETWIPSEGKYRETQSASNVTDFQARRLNIRYRDDKTGRLEFVHMLNDTAFAIGRMIIAILENYQQKDGSIKVPEVLHKYTGFQEIKKAP